MKEITHTTAIAHNSLTKPIYFASTIGTEVIRVGNIFIKTEMFNQISKGYNIIDTLKKISDTLWRFEKNNNFNPSTYVLSGYNCSTNLKVESAYVSGNSIKVMGDIIAILHDNTLSISKLI